MECFLVHYAGLSASTTKVLWENQKGAKIKIKNCSRRGKRAWNIAYLKSTKKIGTFAIGNKHHKKETLVAYEIKVGLAEILS